MPSFSPLAGGGLDTQCNFHLVMCRLATSRCNKTGDIMKISLIEQVLALENIKSAYLELSEQFDLTSHSARYEGLDATKLSQVDYQSMDVISAIRDSIINKESLVPVRLAKIPKRRGGFRNVYILSVRDRIRAKAIYRVLEPLCEKAYSRFLFSYRSNYSSFFAGKSLARRYRRYHKDDYVLTMDLKSYSDYIDHDILKEKLFAIGVDQPFYELLEPFLKVKLCQNGDLIDNFVGIPQGTPLTALFANLYMNDVDKKVGPQVDFYRRVGDDLIVCDKNKQKVEEMFLLIKNMVGDLKLKISDKKTHILEQKESFDFLGYTFKDGKIGLDASFINNLLINWRRQLNEPRGSVKARLNRLHVLAFKVSNSFANQFSELFKQHPQIENDEQMKQLSNQLYNYLTKYLYAKFTPRFRRLATDQLKKIKFPSFYDYYLHYRREKNRI